MSLHKPTPRFIPAKFDPTSEQKAIQVCTSRSVVAMASAGAAKSTTLALRIAESITRNIPPQNIIGLTFSQEAADVLKKYVREIGVPAISARAVTIETFDAFASRILLEQVDMCPVPYLATFEAVAPKVREATAKLHERNQLRSVPRELWLPEHNDQITDALKTIRRLKGRLIAPEAPDGESLESYAKMIGIPESILMLYRQLERDRTNSWNGCLWRTEFDATFDLACALRAAAMGLETDLVNLPVYQAVIVDELQDMNPATDYCLDGLRSNEKTYFTGAGDFDQIIHYWSGADISFIKNEFLPTILKQLELTKTFRFGQSMAYAVASQKKKTVTSGRDEPASIRILAYDHAKPDSAAICVLEPILNRIRAKQRLDRCAVILRSPHLSIHVENELLASGIGWKVHGFKSYFERPEVLMLRGVIAYALGDFKLIPGKRTRLDVLRALLFWQELV